jgi:hypothetical protein
MVKLNKKAGFVITEVLTVSLIVGLVLVGTIGLYLMLRTTWLEGIVRMDLQLQASRAMEQMTRFAIDPENFVLHPAIMEADSADDSTPGQLSLDGNTRRFYLSGDNIMYDPAGSDEFQIAENVSTNGLTFTYDSDTKLVSIRLSMEKQVLNKLIKMDSATRVHLRN